MPPGLKIDLTGQRFGRLLVTGWSDKSRPRRTYWNCACDCGVIRAVRADALRSGVANSCGCLQREAAAATGRASRKHNYKYTKVYRAWSHMKARCYDPNDSRYADYGGRGITVCDRWHEFLNFLEDMGEPPEGLTLERLNTNLGYTPQNCVWASLLDQNRNRRISVRVITPDGLLPVKEYAKAEGISYHCARARAYHGHVPTVRVGELV